MTGGYVTRDAGASWRMFNLGGGVASFAFDPRDPRVLYAGTRALYRSEDAGRSWRLVFPDPARGTAEHLRGDHAEQTFVTEEPEYPPPNVVVTLPAVAVSQSDPSRLYVTLQRSDAPGAIGLLGSTDRGTRWTRLTTLSGQRVLALSADADGGEPRVLAVTDEGVQVWQRGGLQTRPAPERLGSASAGRVRTPSGTRWVLYATAAEGARRRVLVSPDLGRSWRSVDVLSSLGLRSRRGAPHVGPVATSEGHGRVVYVGFGGLGVGYIQQSVVDGVARSDDEGRTWRLVHRERDDDWWRLPHGFTLRRGPMDQPHIGIEPPGELAVAPGNPEVVLVTDSQRAYRTLDGGRSWAQVNSTPVGPGREDRWTSRGLDVTTSYEVYVDPRERRRVLIASTDVGLLRSEDDGASWTTSVDGVPEAWRNTAYALAFDPAVEGRVWGAFSDTHDLPRPKMWHERPVASYRGGVVVSDDGGRTWRAASSGLPDAAVTHLVLDPGSPVGARRLWAAVFGHGVHRSDDGGRTWRRRSEGIEGPSPFVWRLARGARGLLFAVVARRVEREAPGGDGDGALYRSDDDGERWHRVALPEGVNGPVGVALDPRDHERVYLAAWGRWVPGAPWDDVGGGVFVSDNGGRTWRATLPFAQHAYDVTLDPRDPSVVYVCGFDQGAWRSSDRGERWTRLAGYDFKWGHRVVPDPTDPTRVYVTTFGGGVWHGPSEGDPRAVESVVRPALGAQP